MSVERERLKEALEKKAHWRRWGPYLAERQWGTVREDYSPSGTAWDYFPHDHARSRAYRWGEDGIAGISDNHQRLCFSVALWNGKDPILKERLFGLSGPEGNHGEDVKEYYYYLDNTPLHTYMKYLYKYPQQEFPYARLVSESRSAGAKKSEFELCDTNIFAEGRYFDVFVEYAKSSPEDIYVKIRVENRGPEKSTLSILPTLWFRNDWAWKTGVQKPKLSLGRPDQSTYVIEASHPTLGKRWLYASNADDVVFTDNETNYQRIFGLPSANEYFKDGIDRFVVKGNSATVNSLRNGTKAAVVYRLDVEPGASREVVLRLCDQPNLVDPLGQVDRVFAERMLEADQFYSEVIPSTLSADAQAVQRQALAGMLWNKQYYHYVVEDWIAGDPLGPPPPANRHLGRNADWRHVYTDDVLSMPDKWEYPWFAAWDTAFHVIPLALVDPDFAKKQMVLLTREWYMHPNGQIPAYEWAFGDVNPPVHAWAAWRVYKMDFKRTGKADRLFLERVFQKLLLNFTWWVNQKDPSGKNVFQGGFLGLDNIGVFDRSATLPTGGHIQQSDGTSWMGMFSLSMLTIALELAQENKAYEDIASKFFEHFLYIANAMNYFGGAGLWDEEDGFYYDHLSLPDGRTFPMKVRSMVGLIPLFASITVEPEGLLKYKSFARRLQWFIENRPDLAKNVASMAKPGVGERRLLSIVDPIRLRRIVKRLLDPEEFLSPYGIRSLSKAHSITPYVLRIDGKEYAVGYEPAESGSSLFGGNSNWRGPVWFPVNYLIIESLQRFHHYLGDSFKVECPTGSGNMMTLWEVADEISRRLTKLFLKDSAGRRPVYGTNELFQSDPHFKENVLFYEYFHGDSGLGLGASHQTGWTGLVAKLLQQTRE